ncbi:MAG: hypothetical protein ABH827_04130 [bacterium]
MFSVAKKTILAISLIFSLMCREISPIDSQILTINSQTPPDNQKNIDLTDCPITPSIDSTQNPTMKNTPRIFNMSSLLNMIRDSKGALDFQRLSKRDEIIIALGELVKNDFFPKNFDNNLILDPNVYGDQEKILQLIEYLDNNKNNSASTELLDHLNEFYHIWLYQFIISDILMPKDLSISLNTYYDELYNKKIITQKNDPIFPFRTTLAKIMIYILIINGSNDSYRVKQQNLVYLLNIIKNELIEINDKLKNQIPEQNIIELIKTLQAHTLDVPAIQPKNVRKWVIGGTVIVTATVLTYVLMQEPVQDYIKNKYQKAKAEVKDWIKEVVREFGKELTNGILENEEFQKALDQSAEKVSQKVGKGVVIGLNEGAKEVGSEAVNTIVEKTKALGNGIKNGASDAWDKTKECVVSTKDFIKNWLSPKNQETTPDQTPTTTNQ